MEAPAGTQIDQLDTIRKIATQRAFLSEHNKLNPMAQSLKFPGKGKLNTFGPSTGEGWN